MIEGCGVGVLGERQRAGCQEAVVLLGPGWGDVDTPSLLSLCPIVLSSW